MSVTAHPGRLILCPTPLGNLEDITLRTLAALRACDVIFAEDTRVSNALLRHYEIKKPVRSFHERVEHARLRELDALLAADKTVAVMTDAGMPGISDPGAQLVRAARARGSRVEVLPGPSVVLSALVLSGFDVARFRFDGFPPRAPGERRAYLATLEHEPLPIVWFESPHRVRALLADLAAILPERRLFVLREYTKKFEQHCIGTASEVGRELSEMRGEFTLVLAGAAELAGGATAHVEREQIRRAAGLLRERGLGAREVAEVLRLVTGLQRKELYRIAVDSDS